MVGKNRFYVNFEFCFLGYINEKCVIKIEKSDYIVIYRFGGGFLFSCVFFLDFIRFFFIYFWFIKYVKWVWRNFMYVLFKKIRIVLWM